MAYILGLLPEEDKPPWAKINIFNSVSLPQSFLINVLAFPNERQQYLEQLRNKISDYENTRLFPNDNWEYYKKIANPYELVYTQTKYPNFPQSISISKPLSRSYFKMIEMVEVVRFLEEYRLEFQPNGLRTAHACEGPGGFIEAIFDLAEKYKIRIHSSTAITLRSSQSNIPGWRRANHFLSKNKQINIIYGEDRSGDILNIKNQKFFTESLLEKGGKVHLYTADGGLDFSDNYENQELKIFPILLASARIGVASLKKGGLMILKFFDIQHECTRQLIFSLQLCFSRWTLYKPAMSRPCNPEQYFIGINFKHGFGTEEGMIAVYDKWQIQMKSPDVYLPYPLGIPNDFIQNINTLQSAIIEYQIKYLTIIFELIHIIHAEFKISGQSTNKLIEEILKNHERKSYNWCIKFRVPHRLLPPNLIAA